MKKVIIIPLLILIAIVFFVTIPRLLPQIFYKNHVQYKDYQVYSNDVIDSNIYHILDSTIVLISNDLIANAEYKYRVFLCNSNFLYRIHTIYWKMSTGSSDFMTNNIFIAFSSLEDNYASYLRNPDVSKRRSIQSTIAHEQTHIILRETLGLSKYINLVRNSNWKIEGFCEWIAFNGIPLDCQNIHSIVKSGEYKNNPFCQYRLYRFTVDYLIVNKKYKIEELMESSDKFEEILQMVRDAATLE